MENWSSLQDVLKDRSGSGIIRCYSLGDVTDPLTLSHRDLYARAQQNGATIRRLPGFKELHPMLLHFDTHLDTITWFWSILFSGAIPVVLPNHLHQRYDQLCQMADLLDHPTCITTTNLANTFDDRLGMQMYTAEELLRLGMVSDHSTRHLHHGGSATAMLMLTSGSTGRPKAVPLSHGQVLAALMGKASVRPLAGDLPFLNWIGLDHVASLVEIHLQALWLGVDQVHVHAADLISSPTTFLSLLHRHKISRTFAPNFFLAKLVSAVQNKEAHKDWDLSNLTILATGGEDNNVDTCIAASSLLRAHGAIRNVITPGFGMTETCAGAIFNLDCPEYDVINSRTVSSLGKCMNGIEMRITIPGEDLQLASAGETGNLEVRGSIVFDGYYRDPQATAEAFTTDGWFRTGDQGTIDSQGSLSLVGRVKDVVNINGAKFSMSHIQAALDQALSHLVARLFAFVSRAAHTEQVVVAYIPKSRSTQIGDILSIEEVAFQTCHLQFGAGPVIFSLLEASVPLLPTSTLGKVSRARMSSLYESGAFTADIDAHSDQLKQLRESTHGPEGLEVSGTGGLLIDLLTELQTVEPGEIGVHTSIFELGFSSIDVLRLKLLIRQRLGMSVPVTTIIRHPTPSALAKALPVRPYCTDEASSTVVNSGYDPVVVFKATGNKTPLWLVHPGIGEVLVFVGLAQHMGNDDRPVYALRARGFDPGHERFKSIEEAVDTYIAAIRTRQPRGPYAIAGYSYGTMLAFEISKRLEATDGTDTVRFLGSFNLPPHIKTRMKQLHWNNCLLHLVYFLGLTTEEKAEKIEDSDFQSMSRENALTYILDLSDAERMEELGLDRPGLIRWTDVAYDLPRMATNYDPHGEVAVLDVFYANPLKAAAPNKEEWINQHLSKWQDFCRSEPRFHEVGGAHYTMIGSDHVEAFSATLRSALNARGV